MRIQRRWLTAGKMEPCHPPLDIPQAGHLLRSSGHPLSPRPEVQLQFLFPFSHPEDTNRGVWCRELTLSPHCPFNNLQRWDS